MERSEDQLGNWLTKNDNPPLFHGVDAGINRPMFVTIG